MAKTVTPLKLGKKSRIVEIPRVKGKSYPRTTTPRIASVTAVERLAETLTSIGFTREAALLSIATILHENLVALKKFHNLTEGK